MLNRRARACVCVARNGSFVGGRSLVVREGRVLGFVPEKLQPEQGAENLPRGFPADSGGGPVEMVRREDARLLQRTELLQLVRPPADPHEPSRIRYEALRGVRRVRESSEHRRGHRHRVHRGGVEFVPGRLYGGRARGRWDRGQREVSRSDTGTPSLFPFKNLGTSFFFNRLARSCCFFFFLYLFIYLSFF